ncbi:carnitine 3-dehydrogenase [Candidatus Persebacteraceae bacterium Df01]|jgi:carnitine 3-dehydrogenase|uniref:L-carnitine dehydrogenase n=1 Tax=Candidatus Doriopsillibacter californiensis TaxID=2970740 RepID=A0ABT7QL95_9GAMM|nr:carnitine 3-dehydrogenase [Candidatus Persebacteraceae bacterium Df01]
MMERVALIGGGVIGGGWAARLLLNGVSVCLYDPAPKASQHMHDVLQNAERAYAKLGIAIVPATFSVATSVAEAVADAKWIIESAPENIKTKRKIYAEIEDTAPETAVIASSTSGLRPSDLQADMQRPERLLVAHPFNPVYLLPLVEVVNGARTAPAVIDRAMAFYSALGMYPLRVKKEIDAFIADRLLEAVWREGLWLVHDDVATTQDIDDAIRYGFGLRWAQMGLFETYRLAGGEAGMRHFLQQFGPSLRWPWTKLMDVPPLDEVLIEKIVAQSDAQSGEYSIRDLERRRDDNLIAILQALKANQWGAGKTLAAWEKQRRQKLDDNSTEPLLTLSRRVPAHWADMNGHMNESRYLECFSDATEALMRHIGADDDYIASGYSYFTAETHLCHLQETVIDECIVVHTQVLGAADKKLHLFHQLKDENGNTLATGEHFLIHVNLQTRRACPPLPSVRAAADLLAQAHAALPNPPDIGRAIKSI